MSQSGGKRATMLGKRRIGTDNGFLLACYFVPAWLGSTVGIWAAPIHGVYQRTNIGPAIVAGDFFHLSVIGMTRFAWLLALAKLTVIVFFALFVALSSRKTWRDSGNGEEALSIALIAGISVSFVSMACASHAGELEAVRLHATETMMLLGGAIVVLLQPQLKPAQAVMADASVTQPLSNPSS